MHRFHVPDVRGESVSFGGDEAHHLSRVLRLHAGADVILFDGAGGEWLARVAEVTRAVVRVTIVEPRTPVAEPPVHVTLAAGLLKGAQMDHVVREATALGVAAVVPVASGHVVPARAGRDASVERWRRIAVAAAKQCGRAVVPVISPVVPLDELLRAWSGPVIVCLEPARAGGTTLAAMPRPERALLCVGPEGGWSEADLAIARARGAQFVSLGPRTLRAETAPTVALAALWTAWGW